MAYYVFSIRIATAADLVTLRNCFDRAGKYHQRSRQKEEAEKFHKLRNYLQRVIDEGATPQLDEEALASK